MSLDIYINLKKGEIAKRGTGIHIRDNGETRELSLEEAKKHYPNMDVKEQIIITNELWHGNITHNLNQMAMAVDMPMRDKEYLYYILWRPEELKPIPTDDLPSMLIDLKTGLEILKSNPGKYKAYNPENGWGNYESLVYFLKAYINALEDSLDKFNERNIEIKISR